MLSDLQNPKYNIHDKLTPIFHCINLSGQRLKEARAQGMPEVPHQLRDEKIATHDRKTHVVLAV